MSYWSLTSTVLKPIGAQVPDANADREYMIRPWLRRHPRIALTALALTGFLFTVLLFELTARAIFSTQIPPRIQPPGLWQYDALLGWSQAANYKGRIVHNDFDVGITTNGLGLRESEITVAPPTDRQRLLILGDSYAWGWGVEAEERFSNILQRSLPNWQVINAAVPGYATDQALLFFQSRLARLKPARVLLLFHDNDFKGNTRPELYRYFKPYFSIEEGSLRQHNVPVPRSTLSQRINRQFLQIIWLPLATYTALQIGWEKLNEPEQMPSATRYRAAARRRKQEYRLAEHLLAALNRTVMQAGGRLLLVSTPSEAHQVETLTDFAQALGIPYLSLNSAFADNTPPLTFPNDQHWSPAGHARAAAAIHAWLENAAAIGIR